MSESKLMVHAGGIRRSIDELRDLPTPARTRTWTPVPHYDLVSLLHANLAERGIVIAREEYATLGATHAKIFGVMDLMIPGFDREDLRLALGLRASNDKSMSIRVIAATRVFVCDNMAFSGAAGSVCLNKKHTGRLNLAHHIPGAIEGYALKAGHWVEDLDRMREVELTDARAKVLIFDAFASAPVLPQHCFGDVARLYFHDEEQRAKFPDRTLWSLNNAFTEAVKQIRPTTHVNAGTRIGGYFTRVLNQIGGKRDHVSMLALPAPAPAPEVIIEPMPEEAPEAVEPYGDVVIGDVPAEYAPPIDDPAEYAPPIEVDPIDAYMFV